MTVTPAMTMTPEAFEMMVSRMTWPHEGGSAGGHVSGGPRIFTASEHNFNPRLRRSGSEFRIEDIDDDDSLKTESGSQSQVMQDEKPMGEVGMKTEPEAAEPSGENVSGTKRHREGDLDDISERILNSYKEREVKKKETKKAEAAAKAAAKRAEKLTQQETKKAEAAAKAAAKKTEAVAKKTLKEAEQDCKDAAKQKADEKADGEAANHRLKEHFGEEHAIAGGKFPTDVCVSAKCKATHGCTKCRHTACSSCCPARQKYREKQAQVYADLVKARVAACEEDGGADTEADDDEKDVEDDQMVE